MTQRHLEKAVEALHIDGLVVVENAIAHDDLDDLNEKMVADARTLQARGKDGPFNYNGYNAIPLFNPVFGGWGFWFFGTWVPLY